jgi:transposase
MPKNTKANPNAASVPACTIGLDLSDRSIRFCMLNAGGEVTRHGRFRLNRSELHQQFAGMTRARIALETGAQSAWVSEALAAMGHEVIVANARDVKSIAGSSRKSDARDAEQLARLARLDPKLLHPIQHRSEERRLDMVLIRSRALLVEARTRLVNGGRAMAKEFGERIPSCATQGFATRAIKALSPRLAAVLQALLQQIENLSAEIERCDEQVEAMAQKLSADTAWLRQVHGVGSLTAVTFVLTLGDPDRFAHSRDVGAYLGLIPRRSQSGVHDPQLGISKCGDRYLRKLLVQCSHHILGIHGPDSALRQWGLRHTQGGAGSKKKATVAVARKLAVLLHRLWKDRACYYPLPPQAMNMPCA